MAETVAIVTARGGSKGIPGKNIAPLGGKPLIAWTIAAALGAKSVARTVVSTDDAAIAEAALAAGAEVPFLRPAELATDTSSHLSVILHAIEWLRGDGGEPDLLVLLQPTSPFRSSADIDAAVAVAVETTAAAVVGVVPARDHPYLVKRISPEGWLMDFSTAEKPAYLQRQVLPPAYALNGAVYVVRPRVLQEHRTFLPPGTRPYVMPAERSLEIDDPWDLHVARALVAAGAAGATA